MFCAGGTSIEYEHLKRRVPCHVIQPEYAYISQILMLRKLNRADGAGIRMKQEVRRA